MAKRTPAQNKAIYARRKARAQEQGFTGYGQKRGYKESHKEQLSDESTDWIGYRELHPDVDDIRTDNPRRLVAYYENIIVAQESDDMPEGEKRHLAVAYFRQWEDQSEDEAVASMREIYGVS
jgi:hypothetical protein